MSDLPSKLVLAIMIVIGLPLGFLLGHLSFKIADILERDRTNGGDL